MTIFGVFFKAHEFDPLVFRKSDELCEVFFLGFEVCCIGRKQVFVIVFGGEVFT